MRVKRQGLSTKTDEVPIELGGNEIMSVGGDNLVCTNRKSTLLGESVILKPLYEAHSLLNDNSTENVIIP